MKPTCKSILPYAYVAIHDLLSRSLSWRLPIRMPARLAAILLTGLSALSADAVPLGDVPIGASHLNVESADFVGEGTEVTYVVVDFRAAGGGSYAFGYRHDGMDTAEHMLAALEGGGVLEVLREDFAFGPAIRGIGYAREEQTDVFAGAFSGPRSWVLWDGLHDGSDVEWTPANVGINGVEFGNTEPTVFLPTDGFYGLSTWPVDDFPGRAPLIPLPGDYNSDGRVDGDDLLSGLLGFGTTTGPSLAAGDADRDGDVDRADVALWRENAGAQVIVASAPAGVPEPGTLTLASLAVGLLFLACSLKLGDLLA